MAAKSTPTKFVRDVRAEAKKVTWPTRKETVITTIMVFIFVVAMSLFFLAADAIIAAVMNAILKIGG